MIQRPNGEKKRKKKGRDFPQEWHQRGKSELTSSSSRQNSGSLFLRRKKGRRGKGEARHFTGDSSEEKEKGTRTSPAASIPLVRTGIEKALTTRGTRKERKKKGGGGGKFHFPQGRGGGKEGAPGRGIAKDQ